MRDWEPYPSFHDWPEAATDIRQVSKSAERLRLIAKVAGFQQLGDLQNLRDLWCFDIRANELSDICSCRGLRKVFIDGLKVSDLACFQRLPSLETLSLEGCSTITDLLDIGKCTSLTALGIIAFKKVRSIAELGSLVNLQQLAVVGGMWTQMQIDTLDPLSGLTKLEFLDLGNTKVEDGSLRPLGELRNLRRLNLPNFYSVEEFGWLSSQLKATECTWFTPYVDFKHGTCKKCHMQSMVMLSGRGISQLCKRCDASRLTKHVEKFSKAAEH